MSNLARALACGGDPASPYRRVRRRLPLLERSNAEPPAHEAAPRTLLPGSVGIADTGDGEAAVCFALELATALRAAGALPHVALTAFAQLPALAPAQRAAFAAAGVAVSSHALASTAASTLPPPSSPMLVVGVPALVLLDASLSVLLEADRPRLRWPPALRTVGDRVDLLLGAARPGLVRRLAEALLGEGGFLLREDQGVR